MRISIVVPTYDRLVLLMHCVAALCAQTLPREQFEIVVVHDGSTDGTAPWLSQQSDVRTARVSHRGAAAARNAGARVAGGDVLAFTDDDCIVPRDWLCALLDALDGPVVPVLSKAEGSAVEGYDVVGGRIVNAKPTNILAETAQAIVDTLVEELNGSMRNGGMLTSNNIAYRRAIFQQAGGFDERHTVGGEERDLNYRLWRRGARLCYAPRIVVQHFTSPTLRQFLTQQFIYGQGAYRFYRQSPPPAHLSPSFYWRLIAYARRHATPARSAVYLLCLSLSQCAVLCGYLSLALTRRARD